MSLLVDKWNTWAGKKVGQLLKSSACVIDKVLFTGNYQKVYFLDLFDSTAGIQSFGPTDWV